MDKPIILIPIPLDQFWAQLDTKLDKKFANLDTSQSEEREELLNVYQVAELLNTTPQNIHAKKRAGKIPFVRFGGRILFKRLEVIESLKSIRIGKSV